jgi:hypothetical protein
MNLVFFIDGLDEFNGNHAALIDLIQSLLLPNIKVCVSSRPWNVFEDGFHQRPSLRVHDPTYEDMKHFVRSSFFSNHGFMQLRLLDEAFADQLIEDVTTKSQGIFLWVSLVTQSLLEGLSDGEQLIDLQRRLDSLPPGLETLFWKILSQLDSLHLKRMSQLVQIIQKAREPLDVLEMSYADEDDLELVFKMPVQPLPDEKKNARAQLLRRRLNACCKGLVVIPHEPGARLWNCRVSYLHGR